MRTCSRSSSDHRGVPGDPNVTCRKFPAKVRVKESGSEDEEEFEDSREDLPPRDPIGPFSNQEQAPPAQSILVHPDGQLGFGEDNQGGFILKGVLIRKILSRMLGSIRMQPLTTRMCMKLYMLSKLNFKVSTVLRHH